MYPSKKITIVIDAGHGGKDPGTMSNRGLKEKKINLSIALKLNEFFKNDIMFDTILTRNSDTYLSLKQRKQILKKKHVDLLISLHANSSNKKYVSGASIWMVSNSRMDREMDNYMRKKITACFQKNIQNIFNENKNDVFLKKTILDLQFYNSQKIALDVSNHIIKEFKKNIKLHKIYLHRASLSILNSLNIPSILIETGFITNFLEEQKLKTNNYQNKIAYSIYLGLKNYFYNSF